METRLYEVDYRQNCSWSMAFDDMHHKVYIEADANLDDWSLNKLFTAVLCEQDPGFRHINSFTPVYFIPASDVAKTAKAEADKAQPKA